MNSWHFPVLLSLVSYGFWAFFPKLSVDYISPSNAIICQIVITVFFGLILIIMPGFHLDLNFKGILYGSLTGICGISGSLFYLYASKHGPISVVVTLTALYPLITILLSTIFLNEPMNIKTIIGMIFAIIAIVLLNA